MERQQWDERYAGDELLWHADPNRFVVEEVGDLAPGTVLDVACGEGRNAIWLAEKGWHATGVDFSTVALAKARRIARERGVEVEWIEADLREWEPAGVFDLVLVMYLHLPEPTRRKALSDAARAVAPEGTILVVGHDRENLTAGTGGPQDESVLFAAEEVVEILKSMGGKSMDGNAMGGKFVMRRADQVRRCVETDDGPVDALDALVRAVRTE